MFKDKKLDEVEVMVKKKREHELKTSYMAEISAIRGNQFGKAIYSSLLPFRDLVKFLSVFPDVQRQLNKSKVRSIKSYTLSGLELIKEGKKAMRFFPGITCTARGNIFYNEATNKIAINTKESEFSVNDGQHRWFGIDAAITQLSEGIEYITDVKLKTEARQTLIQLENMTIPITIFSDLSEEEESQLFTDSNNLATRPSRSATIRLAQTDLFSKMAREVSEENRYFKHYGVEYDKMSIKGSNKNTILLTTIYSSVKEMFWEINKRKSEITPDSYEKHKKIADKTFDQIFLALPPDINTKDKYLIEKSYALRAICKFVNHCRYLTDMDEDLIFETIGKINWKQDYSYWKKYRATETKTGKLVFSGSGDHAKAAIFEALIDNLPKKYQNIDKKEQMTIEDIAKKEVAATVQS
ncbi:DNA sulfur modification protein DndB [Priestia sp. YIM B13551]|uniref:DNA sulfur modification protein DndB n=1 Tax=Priestia sp. YIM B13551 TaxID=3366306 RepID=UPI00366BDC1D